ncbi:MAG: GNAT family protein [Pseudomonadota bacterium]
MHFELLNDSHALMLLDFEVQNRRYFDDLIVPRDASFYSHAGVQDHISSLRNQQNGASYVLIKDLTIIARANIKNIHHKEIGEIGYRVDQHSTGNGIGTLCVEYLIQQAKSLGLRQLVAHVMDNNPASENVLLTNGFKLTLCLPNAFEHQGRCLHGYKYQIFFDSVACADRTINNVALPMTI